MSVAEHHHDHSVPHIHVQFEGASLVNARMCTACGSYVAVSHLVQHQDFHDLVFALNAKISPEEIQDELFSDLLEREAEFQLQEDWWAGKAHFVQEFGLVDAMVNGDEVVAICGWRFVPTRDPAGLRICKRCLAIQRNDKR